MRLYREYSLAQNRKKSKCTTQLITLIQLVGGGGGGAAKEGGR